MEYLGQFSDPEKVRKHLVAAESKDSGWHEAEFKDLEKRLADLEAQFLTQLNDLLNRKILTEKEFAQANEAARSQKMALEARKTELSNLLKQEHANAALIEKVPQAIKTFVEAFQTLDIRQQKAQLQTILKAAHVYRDGRIELDFR